MALLSDEQKAALAAQNGADAPLALIHLAAPLMNWHWYLYAGKATVNGDDFNADAFVCGDELEYGTVSLQELESAKGYGRVYLDDDWETPIRRWRWQDTARYRLVVKVANLAQMLRLT